jgi:hypothetical protein
MSFAGKMGKTGDNHAEQHKPSSRDQILHVLYSFVEPRPKMMMTVILIIIMIVGHECKWGTV